MSAPLRNMLRPTALCTITAPGVVVFAAMQLVPYGRAHTNPPVWPEPPSDSRRTRSLAVAARYDRHGNETRCPWYSNVAPASWLLERDVEEGRTELNFSRFDVEQGEQGEGEDAAETVEENEMAPLRYKLIHPDARLSDDESAALVRGLARTLGDDRSGPDR